MQVLIIQLGYKFPKWQAYPICQSLAPSCGPSESCRQSSASCLRHLPTPLQNHFRGALRNRHWSWKCSEHYRTLVYPMRGMFTTHRDYLPCTTGSVKHSFASSVLEQLYQEVIVPLGPLRWLTDKKLPYSGRLPIRVKIADACVQAKWQTMSEETSYIKEQSFVKIWFSPQRITGCPVCVWNISFMALLSGWSLKSKRLFLYINVAQNFSLCSRIKCHQA